MYKKGVNLKGTNNTMDKRKKYKKKEKPKGECTSVPRPLSWNIYVKS
jgi:hypothetical protein